MSGKRFDGQPCRRSGGPFFVHKCNLLLLEDVVVAKAACKCAGFRSYHIGCLVSTLNVSDTGQVRVFIFRLTSNKKGSLSSSSCQGIDKLLRILIRSVIVCKSELARRIALRDDLQFISEYRCCISTCIKSVATCPAAGPDCLMTWRGSGIGLLMATVASAATSSILIPILADL